MRFVIWLLTNAIALATAAWLVDGVRFTGPSSGTAELEHKWPTLLLVALILGVVTSVVKPVITLLSLPFVIVTLGLFLLVINAAMLELTGWLARQLDLGFRVDGFWSAVGGAIVITVMTWVVDAFVGDERR
ncbi:phage holin family protein [Nocardioides marmotae]|uniref:Phage holin family protein n=1 Tax=Nocardioides marmotae TaxID=2663857 RepID=A0A6I3JF11_9ACTN|nr:phage holin family protein [Nocardioides marmotae]MCR6033059.1 phage holin family protein [Gordonia jinghuaiqii]MBC9732558.1 phage holin family protein [Nocardioides marmotae]MTB83677.1 phage holin family protein [Nocardioides marmotae]MTB96711.1 phage holin family protein [Nocardioides marmotae]QKE03076.1 phage holin family protein [Nocardioides marmotae]